MLAQQSPYWGCTLEPTLLSLHQLQLSLLGDPAMRDWQLKGKVYGTLTSISQPLARLPSCPTKIKLGSWSMTRIIFFVTPWSNLGKRLAWVAIVERKHQHIAKTLLYQAKLTNKFLCYSINRAICLKKITFLLLILIIFLLLKNFYDKLSDITNIKVFGCLCYISILTPQRKKLDPRILLVYF